MSTAETAPASERSRMLASRAWRAWRARAERVAGPVRRGARRVPRAGWIVLAIVLGVYAVYVVGANVILRTGLLRSWLNTAPEELHLDYESAWSPWPGRIITRDFTLRFQDDNVQMFLELETARMTIDLVDLAKKKFHLRRLDAVGARFKLRHKLSEAAGHEGRLAAYPSIPGFPDPPVRKPQPKERRDDESYNLWTIHLEDVAASVRELWIMEYRYRGDGALSGGMRLRPTRELWVSPSVLITRGGTLSIGDKDILEGSETRLEAQVDAFDVRIPRGAAVLRHLTASADLSGRFLSIAPFRETYMRDAPVTLAGGAGDFRVRARVDHGLVHPETRIEYRTSDVTVATKELAVRADLAFVGRVDPGRHGPTAALFDPEARPALVGEATTSKLRVGPPRAAGGARSEETWAVVDDLQGSIRSGNIDLTSSFTLSGASLSVASARVPDLTKPAAALLPPDVRVQRGALSAAARATYREGALDARADVVLDRVHVATDKIEGSASGKVWLNAAARDARVAIDVDRSGLDLQDVSLRISESRVEGLTLASEVAEGLVRTKEPGGVDVSFGLRAAPGDRVLRLGASLASLPKELGDVPAGPDARANIRIHKDAKGLDIRVIQARDGDLVVRGRVRKPKTSEPTGALLFEIGMLRAGIELGGGSTTVVPFASRDWLEQKTR